MFAICHRFGFIVIIAEIVSETAQVDSIVDVQFIPDVVDHVCEVSLGD